MMEAIEAQALDQLLSLPQSISLADKPSLVEPLFYLGRYERALDISMPRMMENALDWEHLPSLHSSSFSDARALAAGNWGWLAQLELPPQGSGQSQVVSLRLNAAEHYWASSVLRGLGEGVQIHTLAEPLGESRIRVLVDFYFPAAPKDEQERQALLDYFCQQYSTLYDEDFDMMAGRELALGQRRQQQQALIAADTEQRSVELLNVSQLSLPYKFELAGQPMVLRRCADGEWVVHSALCPHLLGPLDGDCQEGDTLLCPWHGYRFDLRTGQNTDQATQRLRPAATVAFGREEDSLLIGLAAEA